MWARHASRLIGLLVELDADRAGILRRSGLTEADLRNLDGRVPLEAVYDAVESALHSTGDPLLGIHVAQAVSVADLDAMGFLMMTSPTMGDAIERLNRFSDAFISGERYVWSVTGDRVHHEFVPYGPDRPAHHQIAELVFYDIAQNSARLFGTDVALQEIRLTHAPATSVDYTAVFGAPVRFTQPRYEAVFPATILDVEIRAANPTMAPLVDRYLEGLVGALPARGSIVAKVIETIDHQLEWGAPTLAELAARFDLSPRALQRQLRSEGTSLRVLLDAARRAKAITLTSAGVPLVEIAYLLGYADQTVLHRAFRRWTGTTPAAYRTANARGVA